MATKPTHIVFLSDSGNEFRAVTFNMNDKRSMLAVHPEFKNYINEYFNIKTIKADKVYEELLRQFRYSNMPLGDGYQQISIIMTIEQFVTKMNSILQHTSSVNIERPSFVSVA